MSNLDRRDFVKAGVTGFAGLTLGKELFADQQQSLVTGQEVEIVSSFFIQPGLIAQVDPTTNQPTAYNLWPIDATQKDLVASLLAPVKLDAETFAKWGSDSAGFDRFREEVPLLGALLGAVPAMSFADVAGSAVLALREKRPARITLDFSYPQEVTKIGYEIVSEAGFPVVERPRSAEKLFWMGDFFGLRFVFHGPDYQSLGSCVPQRVWHYNLEIQKSLGRGRFQPISNFHLGKYNNGRSKCYVLWNNLWPPVCWKVCTINWNNLQGMLAWAVAATAASAGIYLAWWMVSIIASTLASVIFVPLLAL